MMSLSYDSTSLSLFLFLASSIMVILLSNEGDEFYIDRPVIERSPLIKGMLEGDQSNTIIIDDRSR